MEKCKLCAQEGGKCCKRCVSCSRPIVDAGGCQTGVCEVCGQRGWSWEVAPMSVQRIER